MSKGQGPRPRDAGKTLVKKLLRQWETIYIGGHHGDDRYSYGTPPMGKPQFSPFRR
jgi:hypothetical protein